MNDINKTKKGRVSQYNGYMPFSYNYIIVGISFLGLGLLIGSIIPWHKIPAAEIASAQSLIVRKHSAHDIRCDCSYIITAYKLQSNIAASASFKNELAGLQTNDDLTSYLHDLEKYQDYTLIPDDECIQSVHAVIIKRNSVTDDVRIAKMNNFFNGLVKVQSVETVEFNHQLQVLEDLNDRLKNHDYKSAQNILEQINKENDLKDFIENITVKAILSESAKKIIHHLIKE